MKSPIKIMSKKSMSCGRATIVEIEVVDKYTGEVKKFSACAIRDPQDVPNETLGIDIAEERAIMKAYKYFRKEAEKYYDFVNKLADKAMEQYTAFDMCTWHSQAHLEELLGDDKGE